VSEAASRAQALARALASPGGSAVLTLLAAAETTIIAADDPRVLDSLAPFLSRLLAHGARPGRLELVVVPGASLAAARASVAARVPGLRVHVHDRERATWFTLPVSGLAIELSDVLRESEAIVLAGMAKPGDRASLTRLLVPGLASPATRDAGGTQVAEHAAESLAIDAVIAFDPGNPARAYCGALAGIGDETAWS
jgi:hypothetical protein